MTQKQRKLASVQVIWDVQPIPNADAIEVVSVLGWKVVAQKGQFKKQDKCVYIEVDSVMPEREEFEFIRKRGNRVKTIRLRKQLSQGIVFPLSILPDGTPTETGMDVTAVLGVTQFQPVIPACLNGIVRCPFPDGIPKTDEMRIQAEPGLIDEMKGKEYYITVKIDGSSGTFANIRGDIHVCSRNLSLEEKEGNTFWKMFHKYNMKEIFEREGNFAIQGEVAGPSIAKNPLQLKDHELFVFNVFNIDKGKYLGLDDMIQFCQRNNLVMVPVEERGLYFPYLADNLLERAKGKYPGGKRREGIVIRPQLETYSGILGGRLSFKVINNDFLLKDDD